VAPTTQTQTEASAAESMETSNCTMVRLRQLWRANGGCRGCPHLNLRRTRLSQPSRRSVTPMPSPRSPDGWASDQKSYLSTSKTTGQTRSVEHPSSSRVATVSISAIAPNRAASHVQLFDEFELPVWDQFDNFDVEDECSQSVNIL
jgi:hypothetical protein